MKNWKNISKYFPLLIHRSLLRPEIIPELSHNHKNNKKN